MPRSIALYPHQKDAVAKMKNGCILCGGVGSGKSRTALAYYFLRQGGSIGPNGEYGAMRDTHRPLYIITTARKRDTREWEGETIPFLLPEEDVTVDSWNNVGKYTAVADAFFIFDEQRVVGNGAWVKSFLKITKNNKWILLSATPGDSWIDYIPVFIANGFYKNRTAFLKEHVVFNSRVKFPKVERYIGTGKLIRERAEILVQMPSPVPAKLRHIDIRCSYDKESYFHLLRFRQKADGGPIENASQFCYEMRRIVNSAPERIETVKKIAAAKGRIIVFYNFDYELDILRHASYGTDTAVAEWSGHKHEPIPDTEKWVYLVQYTAGAEGWNCIKTDTIVFYSQNYSYKIMVQAAGRTNRINTGYTDLYYYHLLSDAPIDKSIKQTLSRKKKFNESEFVNRL